MAATIEDKFIDSWANDSYLPEEVLFKAKTYAGRETIASIFENKAKKLKKGETIAFGAGEDALQMGEDVKYVHSVGVRPPSDTAFEIKITREGPTESPPTKSLEFKLTWDENGGGGDDGNGPSEAER